MRYSNLGVKETEERLSAHGRDRVGYIGTALRSTSQEIRWSFPSYL